ncbi:hypothetical protein EZV62_015069 [Acer yangbiense]|uniref:SWIM-type domain-containing protein n=1 Tax=Acer yangbiense TaxID=1000413 RepID=A0A5C7HW08_9ROSI|nr:hypothetical protein EZV62_015069 [Acer yangbiense]
MKCQTKIALFGYTYLGVVREFRPNEEPEVLDQQGDYQALGWCDFEAEILNYDGDSEKDDDKDVEDVEDGEYSEEESRQANEGQNMQYDKVPVFEEESIDGDDDIINECMDLFEGYQSKSDDEYFSDSKLEPEQVRIAKLMKGITFKKMMGGEIKFEVGQTFDNAEQMREVFRKIYNNKEAKVKWIASKFENLVRRNPSICVKVISNLLREKYKVSVDIQRLYKAKKRALEGYCARHAYDQTIRCDHVTNKMTEAFNSMLGPNEGYVVKLSEYSCQCGSWQVSGIPCRHAMAAISHHYGKATVKDKLLNLINPPLMAIVELDDVSMIVLDALDLCCLCLIDIVVVG